ncbi:MAG: DUF4340 domain-containing protein [Planctomycetia bacterium]|nr:DUF4340 domain-containing protein [Planctomycetia bacterium]
MKNEAGRTVAFLVAAGAMIGLALYLSPPGELTPEKFIKARVGKPFYEDFSANDATSIRVVSYDEAQAASRVFGVKVQNGKWTIPSHHNYPADGQDRLAKTAASAKGIKRDELVSTLKQDQEQLGVIDPLDKDRTELKGRGQRITLLKGEDTLIDLIIGKAVKDRPGFYYVRKPDEEATFASKLDLNLSTKFSDWVETDLLKLNRDDLKEITLDLYSIDKVQRAIVKGDVVTLERDKLADPWKLDGIDDSKDEVDVSKVNGMLGALDDLKLVGVRPKPKGFKPDLSLDLEFVKRQADLANLAADLDARGFALSMDKEKRFRVYSDQGDLIAATNKGVVYTLRFGDLFLGDEAEIEIGGSPKDKTDKKEGDEENKDDAEGEKAKGKEAIGKQSSRYLFVTASFDEKYLGPRPEKPVPPEDLAATDADAPASKPKKSPAKDSPAENGDEKPEKKAATDKKPDDKSDDKPANEADAPKKSDESCVLPSKDGDDEPKQGADAKPAERDAKKDATAADPAKDDQEPDAGDQPAKPEIKPAEKKKSPEELKKEYDAQVRKYEADLKAYEDKVTAGKKLVDELNARFSGWYYVISADYFNKLHLSRKELVKEKGKPADGTTTDPNSLPKDDTDLDTDKSDDAADKKPADKKPADGEAKKPDDKDEKESPDE